MFPMSESQIQQPLLTRQVRPGCEYALRPRILAKRPMAFEESDVSSNWSLSTKSSFAGLNSSSCHFNTSISEIKEEIAAARPTKQPKKQPGNGKTRGGSKAKAVILQEADADGSTDSEVKKRSTPPSMQFVLSFSIII